MSEMIKKNGFQLGRKKTGGIAKGQFQQKTRDWLQIAEMFKGDFTDRAIQIMESSIDEDFMRHYKDLLEYFRPRMSRVEVTKEQPYIIDLSGLTREELEILAGPAGSD